MQERRLRSTSRCRDSDICNCSKSGERFCIYTDGHAVARGSANRSFLGSLAQICASFYHIEPTPEGGIEQLCLSAACGGLPCPRKTVVCVARLRAASDADATVHQPPTERWCSPPAEDIYCARYSNCFKGSSEANLHAERFLISDAALLEAIDHLPRAGGTLTLYLTYQPCHHSGGHKRQGMGSHGTSCTAALLKHMRTHLTPRNVRLAIRVAYLYRAHWEDHLIDAKYRPYAAAAAASPRTRALICHACRHAAPRRCALLRSIG